VSGFRGRPPANLRLLEETLAKFSQLIIDFPQIIEADVNPLFVNESGVIALDARIIVDLEKARVKVQPYSHLIIRPYPSKYVFTCKLKDGRDVLLRPVKPEDEPLLVRLFETFSEETMQLRFFHRLKETTHEMLARYCNIDYDWEMTLLAELGEGNTRMIVGMARLVMQPDGESGEVSLVVGDPWQNKGLGTIMLETMTRIGRDMGLKRVFGEILAENTKMIHICRKEGFEIKPIDEETYIATLEISQ
jgi:acetyltransferase